jgi:dihydrofolate reductase
VRIAGGADAIRQYLDAGVINEFSIALAPILFGSGVRLFEGIDQRMNTVDIVQALHSPMVNHLKYAVRNGPST